jgi:hypothetical protein
MNDLDGTEFENDYLDDWESYKMGCHGFNKEDCKLCENYEICKDGMVTQ